MVDVSLATAAEDGDVLVRGLTKEGVADAPDGLGPHLADRGFEGELGVVVWVPGDDGIRAKDGKRLAFTALGSDSKEGEGTVLALQEFFAEIGVELTPALEGDTFFDTLLAHDYGVALVSYTFAPDPDQSLAWASDSIYNAWSFSNARVDELLKEGLATSDVEVRKPIYLEIQQIIQAELPAAVLFFPQRVTGVNNRVANYTPTAVGYYWAIAYDAPTWEIAAE